MDAWHARGTMRHATLIVNPHASEVTEKRLAAVERVLRGGLEVTVLKTERPLHANELVREAEGEAILVYGGDGAFNEALNGLERDLPIGFLPGGRTSVLPRALGLPRDPVQAARRLVDSVERGRFRRISLGCVNGRRFAFAAGVGLDAELVRRVDALGRSEDGKRPGDLAYIRTTIGLLRERRARFAPALELDGMGRAAFALVANGDPYTYAGRLAIHVAPESRFELGLDLVAPESVKPASIPRLLRYAFTGRGQTHATDIRYAHDLDRIELVCDRPLPLQADGEDLGDVERAEFVAEREAVSVLV
jgi:diacylglycerol kinase family enzyme